MKKLFKIKIPILLLLFIILNSCSEQYVLQTNTFEDAIVVEATITNEFKKQEIKISRTYRFEDTEPKFETGATVYITDDLGNQYLFEEEAESYISVNAFQASPGRFYKLNITTNQGKTYTSTTETLTTINEINNITTNIVTKDGERGVQINVDSFDPNFASKYYRYEYEEAYKIIAPKWVRNKAIVTGPEQIGIQPISTETKTCYSIKKSTDIMLSNTTDLNEDRENFPIRFISNQNYIITHRYSILVKRYVENLAAYTFYKTLKEISASGSVLSQNQPGFFYGNIKSVENPNEKAIGFFEVASISTKRIFFNYTDIFPQEPLPPYYNKCEELVLYFCFGLPPCVGDGMIQAIEAHTLTYYYNDGIIYHMYEAPCGDCTTFSSNIKPLFWID